MISEEVWLQEEKLLLPYGTNMAYFSTIITLCCVFGYMSPLILVPTICYIIFRNLADCKLMVCFNKKETEEFGRLATFGIKRILFGVMLGQFLLLLLSYFHSKPYAFYFNIVVIIVYLVWDYFLCRKLRRINSLEFLQFDKEETNKNWTEEQKGKWLSMYNHPIFKSRPELVEKMVEVAKSKHLEDCNDPDIHRLESYLTKVDRFKDTTLEL